MSAQIAPNPESKFANYTRALWKEIVKNKHIYLMLLPGVVVFFVFRYIPMYGIQLAFKEYKLNLGIYGSPWVGLDHFERMMIEPEFFTAFRNTLIISFLRILWGFPFPIMLAIMLNQLMFHKLKRVLQTIYTFPHFLSWVIIAGITLNLFGDNGAAKKIAQIASGTQISNWDFLYNKYIFRSFLIAMDIWKEAGWGTIIYLAAMAGIDPAYYEASTIDGAGRWQQMRYITIPGIAGMIAIQFILRVGGVMEGGFEQIFMLYNPAVYQTGDIIDTYIYRITFQRQVAVDFGFPTAVGLFKNVINFTLLLSANFIARRFGHDGII